MKRSHVLTEKEIKRVFASIARSAFPARNRAMFQLSIYAGMRVGEIAALQVQDVLAADGSVKAQLQLSAAQTKGNDARTVLLNTQVQAELAEYLRKHKPQSGALFVSKVGRAFSSNSLCQLFARIYSDSGVDAATSHAGRHYFLTTLADKGVSIHVLAALAGHKNISTTMVYLTANANVMRAAVELI
jgi:integrase/recombinase XerD